jgi:hypothetical protein
MRQRPCRHPEFHLEIADVSSAWSAVTSALVRRLPTFTVMNSGAASLSHDGDRRAACALIDGEQVEIGEETRHRDR